MTKRYSDDNKAELHPDVERRFFTIQDMKLEKRVDEETLPKITGYAAVFNKYSVDMGFREKIAPGAFRSALKTSDARALFNHNPDYVLGRQSAGTLTLREDDRGLWMEVDPPNTSYARDLIENIRLKNIKEQSFGFTVKSDSWEDIESNTPTRTLLEIGELYDTSVVSYPAYGDTTVALRSLERAKSQVKPAFSAMPEETDTTIDDIRSIYDRHVKDEEINDEEKASCIQSLKRLLDIFEPKVEPMQDDGVKKEEDSKPMQGEEARDVAKEVQNTKFKKYGMEIFSYENNN